MTYISIPTLFLALSLAASVAVAEETPAVVTLPAEFSETAKTNYANKMKQLRAQMDNKRWEQALATSMELTQLRPREPQARFIRSVALTELGRTEDAKKELLALVTDHPELPEPHNNLAAIYASAGEYALAQRELELAIAAAPDYATGEANLAELFLQQALNHYEAAAKRSKNAAERKILNQKVEALKKLME